ncbi:hypothetical protein LP419_38610 [Massilia sp. H-1]|nr:hypothetical protein LP419_38610 [Massilia sp. H-1]
MIACGIDCFRIQFPKGMDANEYALKVQLTAKSLGALIRKAAWMGRAGNTDDAPCALQAKASRPSSGRPCLSSGARERSSFSR